MTCFVEGGFENYVNALRQELAACVAAPPFAQFAAVGRREEILRIASNSGTGSGVDS